MFFPPCHPGRTWQRAELMCWRKAPYTRREDYRGALSRSLAAQVNWFVLKYYIGIHLIPAVVLLYGFHSGTRRCQSRCEARLPRCLCSLVEVICIDVGFLLYYPHIFFILYCHWSLAPIVTTKTGKLLTCNDCLICHLIKTEKKSQSQILLLQMQLCRRGCWLRFWRWANRVVMSWPSLLCFMNVPLALFLNLSLTRKKAKLPFSWFLCVSFSFSCQRDFKSPFGSFHFWTSGPKIQCLPGTLVCLPSYIAKS